MTTPTTRSSRYCADALVSAFHGYDHEKHSRARRAWSDRGVHPALLQPLPGVRVDRRPERHLDDLGRHRPSWLVAVLVGEVDHQLRAEGGQLDRHVPEGDVAL